MTANETVLFAFIFLLKGLSRIVSINPKELPFSSFKGAFKFFEFVLSTIPSKNKKIYYLFLLFHYK